VNRLINTGYKRDLKIEDLWDVDEKLKSQKATEKIENVWDNEALIYMKQINEATSNSNAFDELKTYSAAESEHFKLNVS
jgi:hypothetical protein